MGIPSIRLVTRSKANHKKYLLYIGIMCSKFYFDDLKIGNMHVFNLCLSCSTRNNCQ